MTSRKSVTEPLADEPGYDPNQHGAYVHTPEWKDEQGRCIRCVALVSAEAIEHAISVMENALAIHGKRADVAEAENARLREALTARFGGQCTMGDTRWPVALRRDAAPDAGGWGQVCQFHAEEAWADDLIWINKPPSPPVAEVPE